MNLVVDSWLAASIARTKAVPIPAFWYLGATQTYTHGVRGAGCVHARSEAEQLCAVPGANQVVAPAIVRAPTEHPGVPAEGRPPRTHVLIRCAFDEVGVGYGLVIV